MDKFSPYKIAQVPIFCFEFTFCFKSFNKILTQVCGGCGIQFDPDGALILFLRGFLKPWQRILILLKANLF